MLDDFIYFDSGLCRLRRHEVSVYSRVLRERLLPLVNDIEQEVSKEGERLLEEWECYFDPDRHDPGEFQERAYDEAVAYGLDLCEANSYVLALGIAGLYHLWEKQITELIQREVGRYRIVPKIRGWEDIKKCLEFYSTRLEDMPVHDDLYELRCVANAVKHSGGPSYEELKAMKADILRGSYEDDFPVVGGETTLLKVGLHPRPEHVERYSSAVLSFWDYDYWKLVGDKRFPSP